MVSRLGRVPVLLQEGVSKEHSGNKDLSTLVQQDSQLLLFVAPKLLDVVYKHIFCRVVSFESGAGGLINIPKKFYDGTNQLAVTSNSVYHDLYSVALRMVHKHGLRYTCELELALDQVSSGNAVGQPRNALGFQQSHLAQLRVPDQAVGTGEQPIPEFWMRPRAGSGDLCVHSVCVHAADSVFSLDTAFHCCCLSGSVDFTEEALELLLPCGSKIETQEGRRGGRRYLVFAIFQPRSASLHERFGIRWCILICLGVLLGAVQTKSQGVRGAAAG